MSTPPASSVAVPIATPRGAPSPGAAQAYTGSVRGGARAHAAAFAVVRVRRTFFGHTAYTTGGASVIVVTVSRVTVS